MIALGVIDNLLHRLGISWWRICDAHDLALGVPDTPQNFPRRHGYVRLQHTYTGSSSHPDEATCTHCGKPMREYGPCLIVREADR